MAIRDIFKMIKADRYTQDGREELIKAQEAVTEDVTYKPGDISRKTGLQKQPDGSWAPVKNAPAQKKTDSKSGSGVPIKGDNWFSLPSGTRITHEGAKEKMAQNNARIETLKKAMEGKSKADNFRLGAELKRLQNENDYISERLPPEQSAPGWRAPGSESDPNTEGSIAWYAQQAKKSPSASGSGLSERAQYSVSQTAAGMSTEALKSHVDKLKNDPATRNSISNPDAMAKAYEAELAKRGETVTKMSDLVAQKSRPDSAPSGRQPTPEMLERDKMRHSPEFQARRDKLDAEYPRTETGAPKDVKSMSISELKEQRDKLKSGSGPENDAQYKKVNDELTRKRLQTLSVGSEVKAHGTPLKITSINPDTNTIKGEFDHKGEKLSTTIGLEDIDDYDNITDSAPRILTGDCKVRIKKSK